MSIEEIHARWPVTKKITGDDISDLFLDRLAETFEKANRKNEKNWENIKHYFEE